MSNIVKLSDVDYLSRGVSYIVNADYSDLLRSVPNDSVDVIYADPPFNTGTSRVDPRDKETHYRDRYDVADWIDMMSVLAIESKRVLKKTGSMYLHLDWRSVYDAKIDVMDVIFGRENFIGEIIWSYNWGARQKDRFSRKHDNILHYSKDVDCHVFDNERVDRVPYKAPELQMYRSKRLGKDDGTSRIAKGQSVTDVFHDINVLGTASKERSKNSYPTMKPVRLVKRLIAPVVPIDGVVLDPFCGSGTTLEAAASLGCTFVVGDENRRAFEITSRRATELKLDFRLVER
jgi:site-specific DNA-methyltransferase (adenine-specific)